MTSEYRKERRRRLAEERVEIDYEELMAIIDSTRTKALSNKHRETLKTAVDTLARLQQEVASGAGIRDLRRLFGWPSEKARTLLAPKDDDGKEDDGKEDDGKEDDSDENRTTEQKKRKKRTTGRRSADEYTAANVRKVHDESLEHKGPCPDEFCDGIIYRLIEPKKLLRITGQAMLMATLYQLERHRCNICGTIYTAQAPDECGDQKYDQSVPAVIALLRYGFGFPHFRLERFGDNLGIPLPTSTQWDLINQAAELLMPAFEQLMLEAAQRRLLTIDDTSIKVIEINKELAKAYREAEESVEAGKMSKSELKKMRTGVHTTGMVASDIEGDTCRDIVLFLTGENHAGENFIDVVDKRDEELEPPIRMADGLWHNFIGDVETQDGNCLTHGRRQFVRVVGSFPDEVELVLEHIGRVYKHDKEAKQAQLSPAERLAYHQEHSKPVMDDLYEWLRRQIDERLVEPNSSLGGAIAYLDDHWERLTLFLRVPGAPLDSNVVERTLKLAIRHRKNSLFYRTRRGARVGDCFMSLIHTAERCGVNAFEYLVALLRNAERVSESPADWIPWNFAATMERLGLSKAA